jgi:hypothetical protein
VGAEADRSLRLHLGGTFAQAHIMAARSLIQSASRLSWPH